MLVARDANRNSFPGLVQRCPRNAPTEIRSTRRWKPRSLTSYPGVVVLAATSQLVLPPSLLPPRSAEITASDVRLGSNDSCFASGRLKYRAEARCEATTTFVSPRAVGPVHDPTLAQP